MCRFLLYVGSEVPVCSLVTEPEHSLIHQSHHSEEREEPLNGDGFGLAWYVPSIQPEPGLFRSISPAWNNQNLRHLARVVHSGCILAHIRAATFGQVSEVNCHPFLYQELAFMHNGLVAGFSRMKRLLRRRLSDEAYSWIQGSTDTEHVFAVFIDAWRERSGMPAADRMREAMLQTVESIERLAEEVGAPHESQMNLVATDGRIAVVTRYAAGGCTPNSLYVQRGAAHECRDGICSMREGEHRAVVVASEPISNESSWLPVSANSLMLIDGPENVREERLQV